MKSLVHVGVDTVNLAGKGFTWLCETLGRSRCRCGQSQPVLKMDRAVIAEAWLQRLRGSTGRLEHRRLLRVRRCGGRSPSPPSEAGAVVVAGLLR
ncbi:MAG: hypothetical protein ACLTSX_11720 [Collinsella sp.]